MDLKTCTKCGAEKSHDQFTVRKASKDGLHPSCKDCRAAYRARNSEKIREYNSAYYASDIDGQRARAKVWRDANVERARENYRKFYLKNRDIRLQYSKNWERSNKESRLEYHRKYYWSNTDKVAFKNFRYRRENPEKVAALWMRRYASKLRATPRWADFDAIEAIYKEAARISKETGIEHHVDHIVPLQSRLVCGLHWAANLRVIPGSENQSKGNRHWPDMP
jgi:hypothetical protein